MGAVRAVASMVGAAAVDYGREMRATADDRGQPLATVQARDDCKNQ